MKRAFVCLLALCAALLTACGSPAATLPLEGGEPVVSPAPEPTEIIEGCAFNPRCPNCMEICKKKKPAAVHLNENHYVRCFLYDEAKGGEVPE